MKVGVVGGGLSGLVCALRLQQAGHAAQVFEAEPTPGGRMCTAHVDGLAFDTGANLMIDHYSRLRAVADEVGVGDQWFAFESGAGGILEEGELSPSPSSVFALLRHPNLSARSRLRLVAFALQAWRHREDLDFFDLSQGDDALDAIDAWTGLSARCGEDVVRHLVDPFVRTFHFHSARLISMKVFDALLGQLLRGKFSTHGFRGLMEALPLALASRLALRTRAPVAAVRPGDGGVVITVGGEELRFDRVVVATPGPVARALLVEPTPAQAALLDRIRYSVSMMCAFRVPRAVAADFEGIWVPFDESAIISCCSNDTCKGSFDDKDCVFSVGLHEEAARELLALPDARILGLVALEWARLQPAYRGAMTGLHVQRWPYALPIYGPGSVAAVRQFWEKGQGEGGIWLCGDYLNHPWLEGAVRCGEKVAASLDAAAIDSAQEV